MSRSRGLTLLESMLTTLILLMVLGLVAGLAGRYRQAAVYSAQKDQAIQAAGLTLQMLRRELVTAFLVTSPDFGSEEPVSRIEFQRVDPNANRLDPGLPSTAHWEPFAADTVAAVRYLLAGDKLSREVTVSGLTTSTVCADGITAFWAYYQANHNIQIELAVNSSTRQTIYKTQVFRGRRDEP